MISVQLRWMAALSVLFVFACSDSVRQIQITSTSPQPESIIQTLLSDTIPIEGENLYVRCALNEFYTSRHNSLMWFKKERLTPQGDSLLNIFQHASYYGLLPEDYHLSQITKLNEVKATKPSDAKTLARLDLLMTDGFLAMANHLRYGRIDKDRLVRKGIGLEIDSSLWHVINLAVSKNNLTSGLLSLEPRYSYYRLLKNDLKTKLDSLALGFTDSVVRTKLKYRVRDLSINMEQWRWEKVDYNKSYIMVNIPSFQLEVLDHDSMVFKSNIVVGTPYSQTPTLDARLINLVLYPYWNVPRDIATQELLPKIKSDSSYLFTNNYRVLDARGNQVHPDSIDWNTHHVNNFPFMLQQSEGEHNALGIIKFNFVNDYNVYLHDTNAKRFFESDKRAYSHGCVRVERALELANLLVKQENPFCSVRDLDKFIKARKQQQVTLKPMELLIRYYTCQPDENGKINFFDDVYGKNAPLMDALYCRSL